MAAHEHTVIVGLGRTGLSMARVLHARGEPFTVVDSRERPPGLAALRELDPAIPVQLGPFDPVLFAAADRLLVSPGVSLEEPAIRAARAEVLGDIELFARLVTAPVVAITGSNGKSTVTALLGEMARVCGRRVLLGANYGVPALDLLDRPAPDCYVLELSSFQLETVDSLRPLAAAVLNLSPDHMDRHGSLAAYASAKARVFRHARTAVSNRDDPLTRVSDGGARRVGFGLDAPPVETDFGLIRRGGAVWLARGRTAYLKVSELRIPGRHNTANALAALALGEVLGLDRDGMIEGLRRFPGLAHRCQWVATVDGVDWYNDSKGTNVGATVAAIRGLEGPLVLIAGGVGKGADFGPLREALSGAVRAVVLYGRDAAQIEDAVHGAVPVVRAAGLRAAVAAAEHLARPGERVLFSPACASFDLFRDFEHRVDEFMRLVRERAG